MRIQVSSFKTAKSLDVFLNEMERKLESMVAKAASKLAEIASENTPVGDAEALEERESYRSLYVQRQKDYGIDIAVGFHAGAWVYTESDYSFDRNIYPIESVASNAMSDAVSSYRLGETFFIAGKGPGYRFLENGGSPKAPQGISAPTIDQIKAIYAIDLQRYYKNS
jgi:hypothetical protein